MDKQCIKILCLHGYRQSGNIFREKTGSLRKILKKNVEFIYMTAHLNVSPIIENNEQKSGGYGWWFSREDDYFKADYKSDYVKGFNESIDVLNKFVTEHGPFDGLLGFSQGAAMVSMLCLLQQKEKLPFNFKFAIIIAGFISQSSPHNYIYSDQVEIPTLHVIGITDQVIGKQMSIDLLKYFHNPTVLEHPGGHFVPASASQKSIYLKFIEAMKELCKSENNGMERL